jgi:hypothetical protein
MDESTRKKLEMGRRALAFCRAHPDSNPTKEPCSMPRAASRPAT